ncbi:uncharacterized protein LOC106092718 [Stomoxys calcitrans]|uniref:Protein CUSTOS n=1 Tax=Stomoxys calcitrans TaxID=35570 RepID=A0A1I8PLY2_STOCA|nr:uncharacterized protein LOC106092718 [Stomoxys calcitrans]
MSSDSEYEEHMKKMLEASDTTFLNNEMFKDKSKINAKEIDKHTSVKNPDLLKSQRYLLDDDDDNGQDFNLPETMQKHMAKKLSEILENTYEFGDFASESECTKTKSKSRVKLLKGDVNYVKSYEEFEYETKGPDKKPEIKRRCVDKTESSVLNDNHQLKKIAIDGNDILAGNEVKFWAVKKERKDRIFHYREGANGVAHAKETINEFTALRRKNNWNESKIKDYRRT